MAYRAVNGQTYESRLHYVNADAPRTMGSYAVSTPHNMVEFVACLMPFLKTVAQPTLSAKLLPYVLDSVLILETGGFND